MALNGALSGKEKQEEFEKKKQLILKEFTHIMGVVIEGLGNQHGCFIDSKTTINIISLEHLKEYNEKRIVKTCKYCGDRYYPTKGIKVHTSFCSLTCINLFKIANS